jgi:hypothetical protein
VFEDAGIESRTVANLLRFHEQSCTLAIRLDLINKCVRGAKGIFSFFKRSQKYNKLEAILTRINFFKVIRIRLKKSNVIKENEEKQSHCQK